MSSNAAQDTIASRRLLKLALDSETSDRRRCDGTNRDRVTAFAPSYGGLTSPVALVGQSLCEKCMETLIPFTGGNGELIDQSIMRAGLDKEDLFISNAVHCHPPKNRASHQHEIVNCSPFLHRKLDIVRPRLVITLGRDAERVSWRSSIRGRRCRRSRSSPRVGDSPRVSRTSSTRRTHRG